MWQVNKLFFLHRGGCGHLQPPFPGMRIATAKGRHVSGGLAGFKTHGESRSKLQSYDGGVSCMLAFLSQTTSESSWKIRSVLTVAGLGATWRLRAMPCGDGGCVAAMSPLGQSM